MPGQEAALYAFVKFFLAIPSLLYDGIYALGPVAAPALGMGLAVAFPFIALRDKKSS
jgi:hypothetical protein